jgi:hypothetical protein
MRRIQGHKKIGWPPDGKNVAFVSYQLVYPQLNSNSRFCRSENYLSPFRAFPPLGHCYDYNCNDFHQRHGFGF